VLDVRHAQLVDFKAGSIPGTESALPVAVQLRESAGSRWILVADGDEASARRVAGFLLHARFRAYPAALGLDGLRLARRYRLRLAVVDVDLPDMKGCELVRKLRAIEPALPVVMTTADYRPTTEVEARQLGIVHYLHKPVDLQRLDLVVARIFAAEAELASAPGMTRQRHRHRVCPQ
jgi:DNA-binding response OmpR family regulator